MTDYERLTPADWGLPSKFMDWRKGQFEAVSWGLEPEGKVKVLAAPVGSGKSGILKAIAHEYPLMSLCRTRNLQASVYLEHGFNILFGRASYSCTHPYSEPDDTAADCIYAQEGTDNCPEQANCPFVQAQKSARNSDCVSLNYALYLTSWWPKKNPTYYLACDEAHLLSDVTLDWVGCQINKKHIADWSLTTPPEISFSDGMSLFTQTDPTQLAVSWLRDSVKRVDSELRKLKKHLKSKYHGPEVKRKIVAGTNLARKLQASLDAIQANPNSWYIVSGLTAIQGRSGPEKGFNARPLTARYHYPGLFLHSPYTILMSGTIGDPKTFATELGLRDYAFRSVPSNFPPETRPIRILDVPHINYKSPPQAYNQQADAIATAILACDPSWSGIVHVTRKREAPLLANRLAHRGLQDRVWVPPDTSTDKQMAAWDEHKKDHKGALGIVYSWTEGVDLVDESICICAKVPWPDTSDPYERARQKYDNAFYSQRTAWTLQQELARTRRGFDSDYDTPDQVRQLVCIADGSWSRLKKYFDSDFLESIQEG